jgi:hypothetical protein
MDEDFEIFTEADASFVSAYTDGNRYYITIVDANKKLNEIGKRVTRSDTGHGWWHRCYEKDDHEQEALLIGKRPIEKEPEPTCELDHTTILKIQQITRNNINKSKEMVAYGNALMMEYDTCPKCGKNLTGGDK